ncbi:MAG: phosphopantetheine-binding protein [Planctomycetaceae bacterium]
MTISSRTPEGLPHRCPVCGEMVTIEPSIDTGDAPCPKCGQLLWWFQKRYSDVTLSTDLIDELQLDSLDVVELTMELEGEFGIRIPNDDDGEIRTIRELVRYIRRTRLSD